MLRTPRPTDRDEGFTLIETVAAVVLMAIVLTGVAGLLIRSTASSAYIARTNVASQLADQQMELVRSVRPTETAVATSKLLAGRTEAAVQAAWATGPAELAGTDPAWDPAATGTPAVPFRTTQTVDGQPYTLDTYIGTCTQAQNPTTGAHVGPCANSVTTGVLTYRILVRVSWERGGALSCAAEGCQFLLTTLVNADGDLIFNTGADLTGPTGGADTVGVTFNTTSASFNVLSNDSPGTNGFAVNPVGVVQQPINGTLSSSQATGTMTYTPNANYWGADGFVYKLTDSSGLVSQEIFVTINVARPPAPTAANYALAGVRGAARTVTVLTPVNPKWHDASAVTITSSPASGATVSAANGVVSYTAPALFAGTETFTYRITDLSGQTANGTITVTVPPAVAANDTGTASRTGPVLVNVRSNDSAEFATGTVTIQSGPSRGTARVVGGQVEYTVTPTTTATSDTLTYRVVNGGLSATATVTFTIPAAPKAVDDAYTVTRGSVTDFNVRSNDGTEFSTATVSIVTAPTIGTATVESNQVRYTANATTSSTGETFTYQVTLPNGLTSTASVTVSFPLPAAPTAAARTVCFPSTRNLDVSVNLLTLVTGSGVNGSSLAITTSPNSTYSHRSGPAPGGTVVYRTVNNTNPTNSSFVYRVTDQFGRTASATVNLRPGTTC